MTNKACHRCSGEGVIFFLRMFPNDRWRDISDQPDAPAWRVSFVKARCTLCGGSGHARSCRHIAGPRR